MMSNSRKLRAASARRYAAYLLQLENVRGLVALATKYQKRDDQFHLKSTLERIVQARVTLVERREAVAADIATDQAVSLDEARSELLAAELLASDYRVSARELRRERANEAAHPTMPKRPAEKLS